MGKISAIVTTLHEESEQKIQLLDDLKKSIHEQEKRSETIASQDQQIILRLGDLTSELDKLRTQLGKIGLPNEGERNPEIMWRRFEDLTTSINALRGQVGDSMTAQMNREERSREAHEHELSESHDQFMCTVALLLNALKANELAVGTAKDAATKVLQKLQNKPRGTASKQGEPVQPQSGDTPGDSLLVFCSKVTEGLVPSSKQEPH